MFKPGIKISPYGILTIAVFVCVTSFSISSVVFSPPNLFARESRSVKKAIKLMKQGKFDKAIELVDRVIQKKPKRTKPYVIKIQALVAQNKFLIAEETYDQLLLSTEGDNVSALVALSWGYIKQALKDESFFVRGSVAEALGEVGDGRALKPLEFLLKDEFDIVKVRAVEAMGRIGESAAIPIIEGLVKSERYLLRSAAVETLNQLGQKTGLPVLYEDLGNPSWNVRARAAEVLGRIGDKNAVPFLQKKLRDKNSYVRVRVAEALALCGDAKVKPIFEETVESGEWSDRVRSARSLLRLGGKQKSFQVLKQAMNRKDWKIRVQASEVLGKSEDRAAMSILERHLKDKRWEVRFAVAKALVDLGDISASSQLKELLNTSDDADVRANAASALGQVGDRDDLTSLRQALKDLDGRVRVQSAKAIVQIRRRLK